MKIAPRRLHLGTAVIVAAGLVAAVPASASAATSITATTTAGSSTSGTGQTSDPKCSASQFSQAQQKVESDLSGRVTQLNSLSTAVGAASHLTSTDQAALQDDISVVELPGIEALQPEVAAATTCQQLRGYAHDMVGNYRVYLVMTPQTHMTIVADDESYLVGEFTSWEPSMAQAIHKAQQEGKDVTGAQAALADLEAHVSAAGTSISGESATLLAQTPQGYPGNAGTFLSARTNETNARNDLHTAWQDLQTIRHDLS